MAKSGDTYLSRGKGASASVVFTDGWLDGVLSDAIDGRLELAKLVIEQWADEVTEDMKMEAPWSDVTTKARSTLGVLLDFGRDMWEAVLTGGMPYQIFLETARDHKYAILAPSLEKWAGVLFDRLGAVQTS